MTNAWLGINQICNCRGKELGDMTLVRTSFEDLIDFSDLRIRARWQDFNQTGLICPCSLWNNIYGISKKSNQIFRYLCTIKEQSTLYEILSFKITIFNCNIVLIVIDFCEFYSSLQCHMIFRNHSNMPICCSRNIFYVEKSCAA